MVHLEYKQTYANLPGRLGSVHYQQFWLMGEHLRIDFGAESSKIVDLSQKKEIYLDHLEKTFSHTTAEEEQAELMTFSPAMPPQQTWNDLDCHVYEFVQESGEAPYSVHLWFAEIGTEDWQPILDYALGIAGDSAFPMGLPKGFPVRVSVQVMSDGVFKDALELELITQENLEFKPGLFKVPPDYRQQKP